MFLEVRRITARAGRAGKSVTIVTQYDVEFSNVLGQKLELWPTDKEEMQLLDERVKEAGRLATAELKEQHTSRGKQKRNHTIKEVAVDRDDDMVEAGMPQRSKSKRRRA